MIILWRGITGLCIGLLSILMLAGCSDDPVSNDDDAEQLSLAERFDDSIPDLLLDNEVAGAAVGLMLDGEVELRKGYGFSNINFGIPVGNRTVFSVGAISTLITGWTVSYLVEEERIAVEVPIEGYFANWSFPESGFDHSEVTAGKLLRHTGGTSLEAYPGFPVSEALPSVEASLSGETNGAGDVRIVFEPGSQTQYSAGGMTAIQYAIDQIVAVNEASFRTLVENNILVRIGMERASFILSPSVGQRLATPYDERLQPLEQRRFTAHAAAGLMVDLDEMIEFMTRYFELIDGESLGVPGFNRAALNSILVAATGPDVNYELGHPVKRVEDVTIIEHSGGHEGWYAVILIDPEGGNGLVVMTNSVNGPDVADQLVCEWYEEVAGVPCEG